MAVKAIFEQQPGESARAFAAFQVYRDMGEQRSIAKLGRKLGKNRVTLEDWSVKWRWQEKLKAWADHLAALEAKALEAEARARAQEWAKREQAHRQQRYDMGQALLKKAADMLAFPLSKQTTRDGKTVVMPADWTLAQASRLAEIGDKLTGLAAGSATERTEITGKDGGPVSPIAAGAVIIYLPEKAPVPAGEDE